MASFIWNRAVKTCAGSVYGIVCRIITAIIVRQVVPSFGITYLILLIMNAAAIQGGIGRTRRSARKRESCPQRGRVTRLIAGGGGQLPPDFYIPVSYLPEKSFQSFGFHLCGRSSSSLLTEQS